MPKKKQPDIIVDGVIRVLERATEDLRALNTSLPKSPPKETPPEKKKESSHNIANGVKIFTVAYHERFSVQPYLAQVDKFALGKLYGELPDFPDVVAAYLDLDDQWIRDQGHAPRFIQSRLNAIRASLSGATRPKAQRDWS